MPKLNARRQSGFTLLEALSAMIIMGSVASLYLMVTTDRAESYSASATARTVEAYQVGVGRWIAHFGPASATGTQTGVDWLRSSNCGGSAVMPFLSCSAPTDSPFGGDYETEITVSGDGEVLAVTDFVIPTTPDGRPNLGLGARISNAINGGRSEGMDPTRDVFKISELVDTDSSGYEDTIRVAVTTAPSVDRWLRTDGSNMMLADLDMDDNNIINTTSVAPNSTTGELLINTVVTRDSGVTLENPGESRLVGRVGIGTGDPATNPTDYTVIQDGVGQFGNRLIVGDNNPGTDAIAGALLQPSPDHQGLFGVDPVTETLGVFTADGSGNPIGSRLTDITLGSSRDIFLDAPGSIELAATDIFGSATETEFQSSLRTSLRSPNTDFIVGEYAGGSGAVYEGALLSARDTGDPAVDALIAIASEGNIQLSAEQRMLLEAGELDVLADQITIDAESIDTFVTQDIITRAQGDILFGSDFIGFDTDRMVVTSGSGTDRNAELYADRILSLSLGRYMEQGVYDIDWRRFDGTAVAMVSDGSGGMKLDWSAGDDETIRKHSCPDGLVPQVFLSAGALKYHVSGRPIIAESLRAATDPALPDHWIIDFRIRTDLVDGVTFFDHEAVADIMVVTKCT